MNRLTLKIVFSGLVTACRLATVPTSRSPVLEKPTTDGVVRPPSALGSTSGSPPVSTATAEFVVPRSMPIVLLMRSRPPQPDGAGQRVGKIVWSDGRSKSLHVKPI